MRKNTATLKILTTALFIHIFHASLAGATPITIYSSGDTYITEYAGYGGITSTHGADAHVILVRGQTGLHRTFPIIKFDLTSFTGKTITSPTADFIINSKGGWQNTQSVSVRESLIDWNETTASSALAPHI